MIVLATTKLIKMLKVATIMRLYGARSAKAFVRMALRRPWFVACFGLVCICVSVGVLCFGALRFSVWCWHARRRVHAAEPRAELGVYVSLLPSLALCLCFTVWRQQQRRQNVGGKVQTYSLAARLVCTSFCHLARAFDTYIHMFTILYGHECLSLE